MELEIGKGKIERRKERIEKSFRLVALRVRAQAARAYGALLRQVGHFSFVPV
jgi:hypothetical protein